MQSFRRMDESDSEQWEVILAESDRYMRHTPDRVMAWLRQLEHVTCGFAVDQLVHVTQTATRARRSGADEELVVAALCHDVGKVVDVTNHPAVAAALLQPYVRPEVTWVVLHHQSFQGLHYYGHIGLDSGAREAYRGDLGFDLAALFADEWDQTSFDPDYDTLPLDAFEGVINSVFSSPRYLGAS